MFFYVRVFDGSQIIRIGATSEDNFEKVSFQCLHFASLVHSLCLD